MTKNIEKEIIKNRKLYDRLKNDAINDKCIEKKVEKIKLCASWAVNFHTGKFSDKALEEELIKISTSIKTKLLNYEKNSVLHIMTDAKEYGGHSRYVANWIKSDYLKNSICFTEQKRNILPSFLAKTVDELKVDTLFLQKNKLYSKVIELRQLASKFEYIILTIKENDVLPLLAFGTEEFNRPIIFINHADHLFWMGFSIADMIVELSSDGELFTRNKRGKVKQSYVLPIPIDKCARANNQNILDKININKNDKIVVSMASSHKYNNSKDSHFSLLCKSIVVNSPNTYFLVIGPSLDEPVWKKVHDETEGRVVALGILGKRDVANIINDTDLYIDSFPYRSYTSFLEFAVCNVPCITLKSKRATIDAMKIDGVAFETKEELLEHAITILEKKTWNNDLLKHIELNHLIGHGWNDKVKDLLLIVNQKHMINLDFSLNKKMDDNDAIVCNAQKNGFFLFTSLSPFDFLRLKLLIKLFYLKPSLILVFFNGIKKQIRQMLK